MSAVIPQRHALAGEEPAGHSKYQGVSGTRSTLQREDAFFARDLRARESSEGAILSYNMAVEMGADGCRRDPYLHVAPKVAQQAVTARRGVARGERGTRRRQVLRM